MPPSPVDVPAFAAQQLALLAAELQSEMAETAAAVGGHTPAALQRAGLALTNLVVGGRRTGMGGRTVLTVEADGAVAQDGPELPAHGLRAGDVVLVAEQPGGSAKKREMRELEQRGVRGVVTRVRRAALEVAVDDNDDRGGATGGAKGGGADAAADERVDAVLSAGRVWLLKLADEVTNRRMVAAMRALQTTPEAAYTPLMRVLFGLASPGRAEEEEPLDAIAWVDPTLNDSQKDAVRFALAAEEVALIHGPPGTGKTHTLVELILQMVRRGQRVLVCGPSNIAVDNLVERLAPHAVPMVRLGHPARLLPSVLGHALDVLTQTSEAGAIVRDVRADMDARQAELKKRPKKGGGGGGGGGPAGKAARRAIYADLRDLRREYRDRERRCVRDLVGGCAVVLATLHGAGGSQLAGGGEAGAAAFDVVVIDEASQALEAQCWVPLRTARKAVLAGDHLQLPPTVKAKKTTGGVSLERTLFDRLLDLHGDAIKRMLTTQYRMHERIMRFPSDALYEGKLVAADAVAARLLRDLVYEKSDEAGAGAGAGAGSRSVTDLDETREPLVFIDTQGGEFPEMTEAEAAAASAAANTSSTRLLSADSKCNAMEALLVRQHVRTLVREGGVRPDDIAVVTPYNAQVAQLAGPLKAAFPGIEVGSVDGFQGREKEAVVVSLVRSNSRGDVGFLAEKRRLNVAMTRPKRSLTVIGDSETVKRGSPFLKSWMEFLEENADLRYPDASAVVAED